jgi:dihydroorotate dehydrogenase (NAD+) catalytic subunit
MVVPADLSLKIGDLTLSNPVMTASGTCGYGLELARWMDIGLPGALVVKGLSGEPREGNPPPRVVETPSGLLNSIGLENMGVEAFIAEVLPVLGEKGSTVIANVYGTSPDDFIRVCSRLEEAGGVVAVELNLSCPNVGSGGIAFGRYPSAAARVVSGVVREIGIPVIAKLTPNVTDIRDQALACRDAGAAALTVANTYMGLALDLKSRKPVLGGNFGGLSGPCIKPLALGKVWECCQAVELPVIGVGGISRWEDAAEFIIAGASAVQVGTATLTDPAAPVRILEGLKAFFMSEGLLELEDLRGTLTFND